MVKQNYVLKLKTRAPIYTTQKHREPPSRFCPNHPGARGLHPRVCSCTPASKTKNPSDDSAQIAQGLGGSCRVHKPEVPRGPASTPGLALGKQHIVHGPAQESKTQRAGRAVRSPTGRSTQKNKCLLVSFFGPPLRLECSLRAPAASKRFLQSEGLKRCFLLRPRDSDPTTEARGNPAHRASSTGVLRADWSHPTRGTPFGRNQKTCRERQGMAHKSKSLYQGPYPTRSSAL